MMYGVLSASLSLLNIFLTDSLISILSENKKTPEKAADQLWIVALYMIGTVTTSICDSTLHNYAYFIF